ncbi:Rpn family recombination-promoting nuclease/putative transposase [Candidatus Venteria ishoeyi]|uniref:PD-(D/E)XK nuclease family transposase n=1 Tax=Candidatus Venteria ishoeyi TaxID=1899563 RepID=A0A1H6F8A5_9GAMM|nr:Rpn family recombination-promoting nuclease/putative transposase [Candidatus Venteria ishoeyi]SEH05641.1 PD-(D/E)XK nuclease family transposase [Candidatus Venteria ishoeyi]
MCIKEKYICPFTDFGFKKLFGTEPNKDILIDFLNELLKKDTGEIIDLNYLSTEQLGRSIDSRKAIYDIYCENRIGEKFIVELQKAKQNYFKDRSIYYSTFPIQQQAKKGDWNFKLNAVYTIGILDFIFEEDKSDNKVYHHEVKLFDKNTQKVFYDKLTYIYLEMPKFTKTENELETHFDKWLYVLKNLENLTSRPALLQEKIFAKLFKQAEIANYDTTEYAEYENSLKVYRDLKNTIDTAYNEGKMEGKVEGKIEGKIEGEEIGLVKGARKTAKKMKQAGFELKIIAQVTELSEKEIEEL